MKNWVFYSIYAPKIGYLENIIESIVIPVVKLVKEEVYVHRWFFIRYIDMQGPHIRLRFYIDIEKTELVEELIENICENELEFLTSSPPTRIAQLLPLHPETEEFETVYQQEDYEPEYEKYGGIEGVEIAERCFQLSSELVINFMNNHDFTEQNRYDIALLLMKLTAEKAGLIATEEKKLWEEILSYWSGFTHSGKSEFRDKLFTAAQKRREVVKMKLEKSIENITMNELIKDYQIEIGKAFTNIKKSERITIPITKLVFNYIHMMNNRLGVTPIEEAYVGALLLTIENEVISPIK